MNKQLRKNKYFHTWTDTISLINYGMHWTMCASVSLLYLVSLPVACYWCFPDLTPQPVRLALFLNTIKCPNFLFKDILQLPALALSSVNNMMCLFPCKPLWLSAITGSEQSLGQADGVQISGRVGRCLSLLICPRETKSPDLCPTFHTSLTG